MAINKIIFTLAFLSMLQIPSKADNLKESYQLGPQDKLEIRIFDLRAGTGEAHKWSAFEGDFSVDSSGNLSLPLIGEVAASGKTTADLAKSLAAKVQIAVGLAQLPSAAVQVVKYRPFYIMGSVEKPGEYEYRPQLTVLQAISIAGGMPRSREEIMLGFERDALNQRGELRALSAESRNLLFRKTRLDAEISEKSTLVFPRLDGVDLSRDDKAAQDKEILFFNARRNAVNVQLNALDKAKQLVERELSSFDQKDVTVGRQIDLMRQELNQVTNLVSKGLAVAPRQLTAEQNVAAFEGNRIDIQTGRLRAQQDLSRIERDILDVGLKYRNEALIAEADTRDKMVLIQEKITTAEKLIYQAEIKSPKIMGAVGDASDIRYKIMRSSRAGTEFLDVNDSDLIVPGDVLKVEAHKDSQHSPMNVRQGENLVLKNIEK